MKHSEIGLNIRTYDEEGKSHSHDHHQLVLPLVGKLSLSIDAMDGEVAQHRAAIIPSGSGHGYCATEYNRFLVADVPEGLAPALDKLPCFVDLDPALLHYIQFLHAQLQNGTESDFTQHQMLLLLIQLLQERHGSQLKLDRRVLAAKQYLDDHFSQPLSLSDAAAVAHLSIRQLNDLFRRQVGMTPHQYLTELRMKEAWRLLEQSDLSIQRVADAVGYSSLSSFSDRFRVHFGKSPRHFRRISK
ncbi:AraC family transcriptional regulator [Marinobacterium sediminicola]|uniref:Helix-turn-helix domain-containing protein n=1 Tax=Marinobacterium sediminicola TaxID=518898 RepID=A0ABY1S3A6_9GAMM|nr:AraC family transcriptional regulator [Marinobacterium sediminicola]ULG68836.1 AraC family transcriptional regulator [Marinobacterium sediminicola]SMR77554.1 Helix-turn-helix domain-containing protein [Marinobacterium sediminicola]